MQISTETFGKVLVVHTPDELTEDTVPDLLRALKEPLQSGQVKVVLQMDRSEHYDSQGLTSLVDLQDEIREAGGNLKISGLVDPGRKIFEITRLDQRFDIFESIIDAVSSFN
jgi:anti-sigma B factor antagonist